MSEFAPPGRLALFLEGGYDLQALRNSVAATLSSLVGADYDVEPSTNGGTGLDAIPRTQRERHVALELAHEVKLSQSDE